MRVRKAPNHGLAPGLQVRDRAVLDAGPDELLQRHQERSQPAADVVGRLLELALPPLGLVPVERTGRVADDLVLGREFALRLRLASEQALIVGVAGPAPALRHLTAKGRRR